MTKPQIFRTSDLPFQDRGQGIRSLPLASALNSEQLLTGFTDIPAGGAIPLHTHSSEEFILVVSGEAAVRIEGREEHVGAMEATLVPPGVVHQFANVGKGPLRILWVYGDPNTTRTLVSTGETLGHLDPYPHDATN
jgi:mannose-6-phosphate isomerase-like protein (cupin superfamily)